VSLQVFIDHLQRLAVQSWSLLLLTRKGEQIHICLFSIPDTMGDH
jgi:hypothetical protein